MSCVPGTNNRPKEKQNRKTTKRRKQIGTKSMKLLYLHISQFTVAPKKNILWKAGHRLCVSKQRSDDTPQTESPQSVIRKQSKTPRGEAVLCATGVQSHPRTQAHRTRRWSIVFPFAPSSFSHSPANFAPR